MGNSLQFILPELVLITFAVAAALISVFLKNKKGLDLFVLSGVVLSGAFLSQSFDVPKSLFMNMLVNDGYSFFFKALILAMTAAVVLISMDYRNVPDDSRGEYYFFLLSMSASMLLAVSSRNLIMMYLALEAVSLMSYISAGYLRKDSLSSEAGVKYFLFGAFSTAVTLYGISLFYGLVGTLDLGLFAQVKWANIAWNPAFILSLILILAGFGFKCSLVPFHMWTPDVYEGAPTPVAGFFSVAPKAMGFALMLRVFVQYLGAEFTQWTAIAAALAVVTMTVGNLAALSQTNIKRLLAYSTIAQAGYMLVGLAIPTTQGIWAILFYLIIYGMTNLGAFAGVVAAGNITKSDSLESYSGLVRKDPFLAVALMISFLSLAGLPPLAGFLAKLFIISTAINTHFINLAVIIVLNSVIALFYYMRVIKVMFLNEPKDAGATPVSTMMGVRLVLAAVVCLNIVWGVWPQPLFEWLTQILR